MPKRTKRLRAVPQEESHISRARTRPLHGEHWDDHHRPSGSTAPGRAGGASSRRRRYPGLPASRRGTHLESGRRHPAFPRSHPRAPASGGRRPDERVLRKSLSRGCAGGSRSCGPGAYGPGSPCGAAATRERFPLGEASRAVLLGNDGAGRGHRASQRGQSRNVPPTPANYAQRSGRAGRSGQPALVFSYCSTFRSHDQYFFRRPLAMVSGSVTPPRIDLGNEDLVRSHIHALWLATTQFRFERNLNTILDCHGRPACAEHSSGRA